MPYSSQAPVSLLRTMGLELAIHYMLGGGVAGWNQILQRKNAIRHVNLSTNTFATLLLCV